MQDIVAQVLEQLRMEDHEPQMSLVARLNGNYTADGRFDLLTVTVPTVDGRRVFKVGLRTRAACDSWARLVFADTELKMVSGLLSRFTSEKSGHFRKIIFTMYHTPNDGERDLLFSFPVNPPARGEEWEAHTYQCLEEALKLLAVALPGERSDAVRGQ